MFYGQKGFAALTTASAAALVGLALLAPNSAVAQNKIVTIVLPEEPDALDNCSTNRSAIGRVLKQNINETLTELDVSNGEIKPRLALKWEQIDPTTWRFHLRPGVFFTDGAPLTAENVGKSIARTMDKNLSCQVRIKTFGDLTLETVAVDPLTLDIKTSKPEPILPTRMTVMSLDSPNLPHTDKMVMTIGTGPYMLESYRQGLEIVLKRNDKYWGKAPQVDGAKYVWRKESAVMAAMVGIGEADLAPAIGKQDANDPTMDKSYISTETNYVRIESQVPPLDDRRGRLALNYAVDRTSMLGTIAPKEALLATHMVIPSVAGWNPAVGKEVYPYDPAKAKQLLAEAKAAGVPVGKHIPDFVSFPLRMVVEMQQPDESGEGAKARGERNAWFTERGYRFVTLQAADVEKDVGKVLDQLSSVITGPPPSGESR